MSLENSFSQILQPSQFPVSADTSTLYVKKKKPDSLKIKFYPRAIRFGTDLIGIINTSISPNFSSVEMNADVDFGKFYLSFDYGYSRRKDKLALDGIYLHDGRYWRLGWDINLLLKDPDKNMLFFGFRYGRSTFYEQALLTIEDEDFGTFIQSFENKDVRARWFELVGGLRVKLWSNLWAGYTCRLKFAPKLSGYGELKSYKAPGYGLFSKNFYWGFNYQIFWSIPFPKKKGKLKSKN